MNAAFDTKAHLYIQQQDFASCANASSFLMWLLYISVNMFDHNIIVFFFFCFLAMKIDHETDGIVANVLTICTLKIFSFKGSALNCYFDPLNFSQNFRTYFELLMRSRNI